MATDSKILASAIKNATQGPKQFGYGFAAIAGEAQSMAAKAAKIIPGFPDSVAPETKAEVLAGFMLRRAEVQPVVKYIRDGHDGWKVMDGPAPKGIEPHEIGVAFAMAYTTHEFGALKKEQPNLHAIVGTIRKDASTYLSNTWARMVRDYKASLESKRGRGENASWFDFTKKTLTGLETRAKNARAKGDTSAPAEDAINKATRAYFAALK
jgi:hypothetical protein